MFSKIEVNGDRACALYQMLTAAVPDEEGNSDVSWNFTKFLVNREGQVIERFASVTKPDALAQHIEKLL